MTQSRPYARFTILLCCGAVLLLLLATPSMAQGGLEGFPGGAPPVDIGTFSLGIGSYKAPGDAISESGFYGLARYEISTWQFEIDYGFDDPNFFLGAVDYLHRIPTAEGVTQTAVALGLGATAVNSDPVLDDSQFGFNILAKARFAKSLELQVRYDFLGDDANLLTIGLGYVFF